MDIITKPDALAIIIAIENYRFSDEKMGIKPVKYARNDAMEFKNLLINDFGLDDSQIMIWIDSDATKSVLENELPYSVQGLSNEFRFYFYYAGHGFFQDGTNRITAWDSYPSNLANTTVSLKNVLLDHLNKSACDQSLIFVDACARELPDLIPSRDLISNMDNREFEEFIKSTPYTAMFLSCSPGESSYSSRILEHGIWTWHLLTALKGEAEDAIVKDYYITDTSLRDYLKYAVPTYIRKETEIKATQTPTTIVSSSSTFEIRRLPEDRAEESDELPEIKLSFKDTFFRTLETEAIKSLDGFNKKRGHFIPDDVNLYADKFVKQLFDDDIRNELKEIYDNAKDILNLKKRGIERNVGDGGGTVETEFFRYYLNVGQHPDDCTMALMTRRLVIRVNIIDLPDKFDDIFPVALDEIVIPISGKLDFDELVAGFENLEDRIGGKVFEDEDEGLIEYLTEDATIRIIIRTYDEELVIKPKGHKGCLALVEQAEIGLRQITGIKRKLLR